MQLVQKLAVAAASIAMSLITVQAKPAEAASLNLGPALTATGVDTARNLFGVDGSGIKIGVISDSFNTATTFDQFGNRDTYETDIANGYLPAGIQVLQDDNNDPLATDEGRAMLQLIHAIAPGASLAFYTAGTPATDDPLSFFGNAIQALKAAGANIIVDDIAFAYAFPDGLVFPMEPNPPDGPINQAIESVFNQGVSYFTSAGNYYPTPIFGHANNPDAFTVGALYYGNSLSSPYDGVTQQGELELFSSAGDPTLPFLKPDVVAPNGLDISFNLGGASPTDPTTGFYSFFGTSASAPFTAAIAALLLQAEPSASPTQIYSALRSTAKPLGTPGFNFYSGYGLLQADKAIAALKINSSKSVPEPSTYVGVVVAFGIGLLLKRKVAISNND